MLNISRNQLDNISKIQNSKTDPGKRNTTLYNFLSSAVFNLLDHIRNLPVYEMSHWINNTDRWLHNTTAINTITYKRGDIILIDLGATNFRYEPSFSHPCIVLKNNKFSILIVPCSSKKYGKGLHDIIDATTSDGFSKNTGIQIESYRWVNKNRVISKLGKVNAPILNIIDEKMLDMIPSYKLNINKLKAQIEKQSNEYNDLELKYNNLKIESDKLKKENNLNASSKD